MVTNINCPNCNEPISPEADVCPHCGTQLKDQLQQRMVPSEALTKSLPDVVRQFDQSATTNITIAGVLIAFYSGAIFAGKVISGGVVYALIYALPLCLLLATIIFALTEFYPKGYLTDDDLTLIKKKEKRLQFSSIFLEVAVGVLIIAVFVYLLRPA